MYITKDHVLTDVTALDIHDDTFIIPPDVVEVATNAINDLPELATLIIPPSVKKFCTHSVCNTGIIHLTLPKTVEVIDKFAFEHNEWLTIIEILNPDAHYDGTIISNCRSITIAQVGSARYKVKCLKYGAAFEILAKKMVDVYTVYAIQPWKGAASLGKLYAAVKSGVVGDGTTIARAMEDCHNQYLTPDIIEAYKDITLDTPIRSFDYKRITGACDEGILGWIKEQGYKEHDTLPARELIKVLGNAYGAHIFAQFIADRYKDRAEAKKNGG